MPTLTEMDRVAAATGGVSDTARPPSVVLLAQTVRAARDELRRERILQLKERLSSGGYSVSSRQLAERVLRSRATHLGGHQ